MLKSQSVSDKQVTPASTPAPKAEQTQGESGLFSQVRKLQRTIGNQNVRHLFRSMLQAQPTVSETEDPLEHEAEQMAKQVVNRSAPVFAAPPPPPNEEEHNRPNTFARIHRQADHSLPPASPDDHRLLQRIESARSGGQALPPAARTTMESGFSADFSGVRIHNDPVAHQLSHDVGARAFTIGSDIFFGQGQFNVSSGPGKQLLAHELTHTIQQGAVRPLPRSRSGVLNTATVASRSPAGSLQAAPKVTVIAAPAEVGVKGKSIQVSANAGPVNWIGVGAPAGIGVVKTGAKTAKVTAAAAAAPGAGGTFKVQATLTTAAGDFAQSANILIVDVTNITFAANPALANQPFGVAGNAPFPAGTAEPNRAGYGGNTAIATAVTVPAARPANFLLQGGGAAPGAGVTLNVITPSTQTGFLNVKAIDQATSSFNVKQLTVNPVPTKLIGLPRVAALAAAVPPSYGVQNGFQFASSDATANPLSRVIGETITMQRDDFGLGPSVNPVAGPGPNPAPVPKLSAQANAAMDTNGTGFNPPFVTPVAGVVNGQGPLDINNYIGPGVAVTLPRLWILRQGLHHRSWTGTQSNEFDQGIHRRTLLKIGAKFKFRTEQIFPNAVAPLKDDAYAGPPLITLSAVTATPLAPAAQQIAADGVATGQVVVATTVAGRNVNWLVTGPAAFTVPALGAAAPVANAATIKAGLVPGNVTVKVEDSIFSNRQATGVVALAPVQLKNMVAAPKTIPAGVLLTNITVNANPGGRVLAVTTVDPAAAAAGVFALNIPAGAPAAAKLPPRQIQVIRPAAFTGFVTVTARDSIRPAAEASTKVKFL